MMSKLMKISPGSVMLQKCFGIGSSPQKRLLLNRGIVLFFTFLAYAALHASRKPFSAIKPTLRGDQFVNNPPNVVNQTLPTSETSDWQATDSDETSTIMAQPGWAPFNDPNNSVLYLSIMDTVWSASYAISMYGTGYLAEKTSLRYSLFFGLIFSGISCSFLGFAKYMAIHSIFYFLFIQLISGFFQSIGWPCVMAIMANWFGNTKLGTITGLWSSHNFLGNIIGQLIAAYFIEIDWALSFIVPGLIAILVGFLTIFFLNEHPKNVGLNIDSDSADKSILLLDETNKENYDLTEPNVDKDDKKMLIDNVPKSSLEKDGRPSTDDEIEQEKMNLLLQNQETVDEEKPVGFFRALLLPGVLEYSFSLFFIKLVVYSFLFWLPFYINQVGIEDYQVTPKTAAYMATMFDVGSIIGSFIIGSISDCIKVPGILCVTWQIVGSMLVFLYSMYGSVNFYVCLIFLILVGIFVNGPASLISTSVSASLSTIPELKNQKAKATVAAIINGTGSIGAAIGPFIIRAVSEYGWNKVMIFLMACVACSALLLVRQFWREIVGCHHKNKKSSL